MEGSLGGEGRGGEGKGKGIISRARMWEMSNGALASSP